MRILLAGTRNEQLKKMKRALERAHCSAECVHDREAALDLCLDDCYDCIALEAAPFCENPPEWIGGLRDAGVTTPLLLLAARGERRLGVAALNAGADDFILLESDLVYESRAITSLLDCGYASAMLITPVTKFQDQYYVQKDAEDVLVDCSTDKNAIRADGELVGIHKIGNAFFRQMCKDYGMKAKEQPKLGYEYELLHVSRSIAPMNVLKVDGLLWYEIDDSSDLEYAEKQIIGGL